MKSQCYLMLAVFLASYSFSCSPRPLSKSYPDSKINLLYEESVGDAAKPQPWEISSNLIPITKDNKQLIWKTHNNEEYLLAASWVSDTSYLKPGANGFFNTTSHLTWVTTAPELQNLCQAKKFGRKEGLELRLQQLIGLPPTDNKKYFAEFWVRPKDLYRPCPDSDITDKHCGLAFPDNVTDAYKDWVNNQRLMSFYNPTWNKNYPWTQLGYTYDWNPKNKDNIGLSEFIIKEDTNVLLGNFYTTEEYCKVGE